MTIQLSRPETQAATDTVRHPLEPLSAAEIAAAVAVVRESGRLGNRARFASITLHEPPKEAVLHFRAGEAIAREAFIILLDNATNAVYEVVVSLSARAIVRWEHIPNVQPHIMYDEFVECEAACKADPAFRAALATRGVTEMDRVMVEPWSAGDYGDADDTGMRLVRALMFVRAAPRDNGYARPVEGLVAVVDLNAMRIVRLEDTARRAAAAGAGQLCRRVHPRDAGRPEARRDHPAGGDEFRRGGPRGDVAEMAFPHRLHAARGAGAAHDRL